MRYEVTCRVNGEERNETVDADDAATAVETARAPHEGSGARFELILVQLVDPEAEVEAAAVA